MWGMSAGAGAGVRGPAWGMHPPAGHSMGGI